MTPWTAAVVFATGVGGLFLLDRDPRTHTSKALWIPAVWIFLASSRTVAVWLNLAPTFDSPDQYLDGSPLDRFIFSTLLVVGVIILVRRKQRAAALLRANAPILLFFFYCALSVFWSDYPDVAFKRWTKGVGDLVMTMIILTDPNPFAAMKRLLSRVGFLVIPLSVLFIRYFPQLGREYNRWTWKPSYIGITTGKNLLGMICLIYGLGSLWRFLSSYQSRKSKQRTRQMIAHGAILVMVAWLFWIASSVTSESCFVLAGGLMVAVSLSPFARKRAIVHLLVAGVLLLAISALFLNPGGGLVESLGRDPTLTGRTVIWSLVLTLTENPLLGTGFESFWLGKRLTTIWTTYAAINEAHDGYLEVFLNLGWIGVILLAVILVTGYRNVVAAFREDPSTGRLRLAYFVAAVAYNFTESAVRVLNPIWIFFLLTITIVPKAVVAKARPQVSTHWTGILTERESPSVANSVSNL